MDLEIAMTPMPHEYRKKRVLVRCYECRNESVTPFHILRLKCRAPDASCGGSYNTVKIGEAPDAEVEEEDNVEADDEASHDLANLRALMEAMVLTMAGWNARNEEHHEEEDEEHHEEDEAAP